MSKTLNVIKWINLQFSNIAGWSRSSKTACCRRTAPFCLIVKYARNFLHTGHGLHACIFQQWNKCNQWNILCVAIASCTPDMHSPGYALMLLVQQHQQALSHGLFTHTIPGVATHLTSKIFQVQDSLVQDHVKQMLQFKTASWFMRQTPNSAITCHLIMYWKITSFWSAFISATYQLVNNIQDHTLQASSNSSIPESETLSFAELCNWGCPSPGHLKAFQGSAGLSWFSSDWPYVRPSWHSDIFPTTVTWRVCKSCVRVDQRIDVICWSKPYKNGACESDCFWSQDNSVQDFDRSGSRERSYANLHTPTMSQTTLRSQISRGMSQASMICSINATHTSEWDYRLIWFELKLCLNQTASLWYHRLIFEIRTVYYTVWRARSLLKYTVTQWICITNGKIHVCIDYQVSKPPSLIKDTQLG